MGHTPGPWHFVGECEPLRSEGTQFQVWDTPGIGAQVVAAVVSTEEIGIGVTAGISNARLIAAAPDLLEACKDCLERLQAYSERGLSFPLTTAKARTAIAKAEGRGA